jgi:hypothetical protein
MSGVQRRVALLMAVLAVAGLPATSDAAPDQRKPILVFESHVGERTAELAKRLESFHDALETHGFAARPEAILRIVGGRAPRPGVLDPDKTAAELVQRVNTGFAAYVAGKFGEAVSTLTETIHQIHRNPGLFVIDTKNLDLIVRAYMALTLSQGRLGKTAESAATMAELIRIMRGQPISRADFGAEAEQLYRSVLKDVQARGRGALTISTGDERAMVFVDGQLRGMGKATLGDLLPGRYRVFVQVPGTSGRQYELEVGANDDTYLDVNAEIEGALWMSDAWVGFQFASASARKQEARFASELARRWTGEGMVAVIGPMQLEGRPAVVGTLYRTDGTVLRRAVVEAASADHGRLSSLAKFLADGTPGDGVDILSGERAAPERAAARSEPARRYWPKVLVIGGLAALGTGIGLVVMDEDPDPVGTQQPTYRDTAPAGVALGVLGLAAVGLGLVFWTGPDRSGRPAVSIDSHGASIGWSGSF